MKGMNEEKMNKISVKTSFNLALILHTNCSWFWVHCSTSGVYFPTQTCNPTSKKHLSDTCLRTVATDLLANWTAHTEPVDKAAIFIACSPVRRINSTDKHSYIVREYCMLDIPDILAAFTYGGEFMQRKTSGDSSEAKIRNLFYFESILITSFCELFFYTSALTRFGIMPKGQCWPSTSRTPEVVGTDAND